MNSNAAHAFEKAVETIGRQSLGEHERNELQRLAGTNIEYAFGELIELENKHTKTKLSDELRRT